MKRKSFVLEALSIFDLEKVQDLCAVLLEKKVPLKKASGEEIFFRNEVSQVKKSNNQDNSGSNSSNILFFKNERSEKENSKKKEDLTKVSDSENLIWQRESSKGVGENLKKSEAISGYKQSNQLYVVKQESEDGKNKLRFASTYGVLVDKKQA